MAWYDNIVETTKGNVQGLVNALRNPQDIVKQGALYKNRDALAALLRGDTAPIMAKLNEKSPANPMEALDAAMMLGTIKGVGKNPFIEALNLAQQHAALPISEGGLGLHPQNTAMERANAMGYTTPAYHGTSSPNFILEHGFTKKSYGNDNFAPAYTSDTSEAANTYANADYLKNEIKNETIFPLLAKLENPKITEWEGKKYTEIGHKLQRENFDAKNNGFNSFIAKNIKDPFDSSININPHDMYITYNPNQLRSRFAAFDPFRRNEADILAGIGAALPFVDYSKDKNKK